MTVGRTQQRTPQRGQVPHGRQRSRSVTVWMLAAGLVLVAGAVPTAMATEADMAQLPVVTPFDCLLCHVQASPSTIDYDLNEFGNDFLANGRLWDGTLANMDSDGDGCLNGVELGDADGDGLADGNVTELQSNPGMAGDCGGLVIDARTWGALKALFDRR